MALLSRIPSVFFAVAIALAALASPALVSSAWAGPPWTEVEFLERVKPRTSSMTKSNVVEWWSMAPQYLKDRILASEEVRWWPVILCNYMGYKPQDQGRTNSVACEEATHADIVRGTPMWSPDGKYVEPSAECRARNKRNQYGQLECS